MKAGINVEKFGNLLLLSVLLLALLMTAFLLYWAGFQVTRNYPMEYRENTVLLNTGLLVAGKNPYALEFRPVYMNVYGIAYQWVVSPFAKLFGNSYFVHRTISCLFIFASAALLVWAFRKDNISRQLSLLGALIFICFLLQGISITARPDSLGTFLFLGSLIVPYCMNFSRAGLAISIACGVLGFLAKPYFFVGLPLLGLYLLLKSSWKTAITYGIASAAALALMVVMINKIYPCYFTEVFFIHLNAAIKDWAHLRKTGGEFLMLVCGFLAVLLLWLIINAKRLLRREFTLHLSVVVLVCMTVIMVFKLGLHAGNGIIYYHQFLTPFVLWAGLLACRSWRPIVIPLALICINLLIISKTVRGAPRDYTENWQEIARVMEPGTNIFHLPHLAHILIKQGKPIYDSGATEYYYHGANKNFTAIKETYLQRGIAYQTNLVQMVRNRQFDRILVNPELCRLIPFSEIEKNYQMLDVLPAPMVFPWGPLELFTVQLWVRRNN